MREGMAARGFAVGVGMRLDLSHYLPKFAIEVPIRYASRSYGETQISRFRHGFMLARMVLFAFMRIKAM